ncbi:MAG: hypothetical protein WB699_10280 [Bacteroidota bacterium]
MTEQGHLTDSEIEAYANALRSKAMHLVPDHLQRHVSDCLQCRKEVMFLFRTNLNMGIALEDGPANSELPQENAEPEKVKRDNSLRTWYRIAAGFVVVVGCGALLWYYSHRADGTAPNSEGIRATALADSIRSAERSKRLATLALHSEPSANMEDLITSTFRGESIRVLKPHQGDTLKLPSTFEWDNHRGNPLTLRVLTNREEERIHVETSSGKYTLPDTLTPGLYYWVIEGNGSLLYAGKVYLY